jgi:hypothetical protein
VQGGEGVLDLGLDPEAVQEMEVARLLAGILEEGVLAHTGFTADDQRPPTSLARVGKERRDPCALLGPSIQHPERPVPGHRGVHRCRRSG